MDAALYHVICHIISLMPFVGMRLQKVRHEKEPDENKYNDELDKNDSP